MNEKTRPARTNDVTARPSATPTPQDGCPRTEDLVTHLYGEAEGDEARRFGQHLSVCASCRDELDALGGVRESIGLWRAEAFGVAPATLFQTSDATTPDNMRPSETDALAATGGRRSALAAFRALFTLSPAWLRAASVAALLLICALAALTLARAEVRWQADGLALRLGVPERVVREVVRETVNVPVSNGVSQQQLDELVAAHGRELDALRQQLQQQQETGGEYVAVSAETTQKKASSQRASSPERGTNARRATRTTTTKVAPRRARDVAGNEEELPRLYDLLSEVN